MGLRTTWVTLLAGGLFPCLAFGQGSGDGYSSQPPAGKGVTSLSRRGALLDRDQDFLGDVREQLLLECDIVRYADVPGDLEEARIHRAFMKGRRATIHARVQRAEDPASDEDQAVLAQLPLSRRFADFRRLRDFEGDKDELARWHRGNLWHGFLKLPRDYVAKRERDEAGVRRHEEMDARRRMTDLELQRQRHEEEEEKYLDESSDDRLLDLEDESAVEKELEAAARRDEAEEGAEGLDRESGEEKSLEKALEEDLSRTEEAQERSEELDQERRLDRAEEKTLEESGVVGSEQ